MGSEMCIRDSDEAIDRLPHEKGQPRIDAALQLAAEMFATSGGMVLNLLAQCPVEFTKSSGNWIEMLWLLQTCISTGP